MLTAVRYGRVPKGKPKKETADKSKDDENPTSGVAQYENSITPPSDSSGTPPVEATAGSLKHENGTMSAAAAASYHAVTASGIAAMDIDTTFGTNDVSMDASNSHEQQQYNGNNAQAAAAVVAEDVLTLPAAPSISPERHQLMFKFIMIISQAYHTHCNLTSDKISTLMRSDVSLVSVPGYS